MLNHRTLIRAFDFVLWLFLPGILQVFGITVASHRGPQPRPSLQIFADSMHVLAFPPTRSGYPLVNISAMTSISTKIFLLASLCLALPACDKIKQKYEEYAPKQAAVGSDPEHAEDGHAEDEHADGSHADVGHTDGSHADGATGEAGHDDSRHDESSHASGGHHVHKVLVTTPLRKDVVTTQQYVCQIHSWRHIQVRALEGGYLEKITVKEGQAVKQGDLLFKILPTLYQARLDADIAEAQLAQIELENTERLYQQKIVAQPEVALAKAKLAKVQAKVTLSKAELDFASIRAPFDGIIDKQHQQQGSLISEGDELTTLSDNSTMWVYFNVPEARYLQYQASVDKDNVKVELMLADGNKFPQVGKIGAIEADFNNETGNIAFRGDFANPDRLLRHGQTGTVRLSRVAKDAIVIPQRATYEILAKKYAYVVDENDIVHQREIVIQNELDDIYVIKEGLEVTDKIVLEGIRQVRDGESVQYDFQAPEEVLSHLKYHAE